MKLKLKWKNMQHNIIPGVLQCHHRSNQISKLLWNTFISGGQTSQSQCQSKWNSDVQQLTYSFASFNWQQSVITQTFSSKLAIYLQTLKRFFKLIVRLPEGNFKVCICQCFPSYESFILGLIPQLNLEKDVKQSLAFALTVKCLSVFWVYIHANL